MYLRPLIGRGVCCVYVYVHMSVCLRPLMGMYPGEMRVWFMWPVLILGKIKHIAQQLSNNNCALVVSM